MKIVRKMPPFKGFAGDVPRAVFTVTREEGDPTTRVLARSLRLAFPGAEIPAARRGKITMRYTPSFTGVWNMLTPSDLYAALGNPHRRTAHVSLNLYGHRSFALDAGWELTASDIVAIEVLGMSVAPLRSARGLYQYDLLVPIDHDLPPREFIMRALAAKPRESEQPKNPSKSKG